ncbi:secretion protein HlyD [Devosia limi DSM 17137]|uniref:Membrane fusion protein (MFP) family protein n=1 Tax=Devosia limi DSM 17137 TaxID=1121477 RepID=A0A0F5LEK1_9HYPH|nr:HlyD family type I secretion periplasmic adaptor subunit [Devosia limi]KKB80710.1 secretion protein HlyD [Devosia limi DSM 17137]SHE52055.1 HlyD family secretion protein [Devosia limi DSM 17137]
MSDIPASGPSELTWYGEVPRSIRRPMIFGLAIVGVAFGGFGVWASTAPLAAAVISAGSFVATGENKIIQHLEGGIIKDLGVREGDLVAADQVVMTLDETSALSGEQQLRLRQVRLEAIRARLAAQVSGARQYASPDIAVDADLQIEVAEIAASQRAHFQAWRDKLDNDLQLYEQNIAGLEFRHAGEQSQLDSMMAQRDLLIAEMQSKATLLDKGLVTRSEVFEVQRAVADADGDIARLQAEMQEIEAQILKFRGEMVQTTGAAQNASLQEMQAVETELDTVSEQMRQARSVLSRTQIKSPVAGTVIRLYYHTTGGVVESGKPIMEILPSGVPLIIEAPISRNQIDDVKQGQEATVRLTALNQRVTPVLSGTVFYVSADSLPDTSAGQSGREVYLARVSVSAEQIARVPGFSPTPGMPAEIMIQTTERTFLEYLMKPVADSMSRAFREN